MNETILVEYARQAELIEALVSALERTEANFRSAVQGHPVRDMGETLAENAAAFRLAEAAGYREA